jgi:hypothetical protein
MTGAQCDALDRLATLAAAAHAEQTYTDEPTAQGPCVTVRWTHADGRVERADVDQWGTVNAAEIEHTALTERTLRGLAQRAAYSGHAPTARGHRATLDWLGR